MTKKKEFLGKDDILNAEDVQIEEVPVPEWDGVVRVKGLDGQERDRFESSMIQIKNPGRKNQSAEYVQENMRARLVAYTVVDKDGKRIFSENDIKKLGQKSSKALDRIFAVAQRLSGITDEDMEELAKN